MVNRGNYGARRPPHTLGSIKEQPSHTYENPIRYLCHLSSVFVAMYFTPTEKSFGRDR